MSKGEKKQKLSSGESDPMASGFSVSPDHPSSDVLVTDDEPADTRAASKSEAMISGFARILRCTGVVFLLYTSRISHEKHWPMLCEETLLVASMLQCVCSRTHRMPLPDRNNPAHARENPKWKPCVIISPWFSHGKLALHAH